jgi:hypothetical protein
MIKLKELEMAILYYEKLIENTKAPSQKYYYRNVYKSLCRDKERHQKWLME